MANDSYVSAEDIENYLAKRHHPAPSMRDVEEAELMLLRSRMEFVCKQAFVEYMAKAIQEFER